MSAGGKSRGTRLCAWPNVCRSRRCWEGQRPANILSLPSSCLVMPLSAKLCFVGVEHARAFPPDVGAGKQSFQDKCVTKLELGHEGKGDPSTG